MKPIEHLTIGTMIQMAKTGKQFIVDSISPSKIVLKECTRFVTFSRSALNERLKRKSATIIKH